jgi:hypothetical protein
MDRKTISFIREALPKGRTVYYDCPDRYAFLLLALLMLFPTLSRILADYRQQLKQGVEFPVFDAAKFADLDLDPDAWRSSSSTKRETT